MSDFQFATHKNTWMFRLMGRNLRSGLAGYMIYRCLGGCQCLIWMTDSFDRWNHLMFSPFVVLINFSLFNLRWNLRWLFHLCVSLWRLCSLLGGCSVIGCLLKTTCIVVGLLIRLPRCTWLGVIRWNHQIIYSYIVMFLGPFGI